MVNDMRKGFRPGSKSNWICSVCNKPIRNAMYMVKDNVWSEAGMAKRDIAHMECFVEKLGRPLVYRDFNFSADNDVWTAGMKPPCCFCLFEEMKARYPGGYGVEETFAKLQIAFHGGRDFPSNQVIVDRCTCE